MNPVRRSTRAAVQVWSQMTRERVPVEVAAEILHRAAGWCEACGWPAGTLIIHHRRLRSQGGKHTAANCIAIHPKCHERIHLDNDAAYMRRLLLRTGVDEALPVILMPQRG